MTGNAGHRKHSPGGSVTHGHRADADVFIESHLLLNARRLAARQGPQDEPNIPGPVLVWDIETVGPFPDRAGNEKEGGRLICEVAVASVTHGLVMPIFSSLVRQTPDTIGERNTWILDNGYIDRDELAAAPAWDDVLLALGDALEGSVGDGPWRCTSYNRVFDIPILQRWTNYGALMLPASCIMLYVGQVLMLRAPQLVPARKRKRAQKTGNPPWMKAQEAVAAFRALGFTQPTWGER